MRDRGLFLLLMAASMLLYSYYFAGTGGNQAAHFDTIRALVETHSFEIKPAYIDVMYTEDLSFAGGKIFSNKPPGLPMVCAPIYLLVRHVTPNLVTQLYLVTLWGSALPAAILVGLIFVALRRENLSPPHAAMLATIFATGTLNFPYSGVLMSHKMTAMLIFAAWVWIERPFLAGVLLGVAITVDYLAAPVATIFFVWLIANRKSQIANFLVGPVLAAALLAIYQRKIFGHAATISYSQQSNVFRNEKLFLGVFEWPEAMRIWWLTFHPLRGLFYCCPVFLLGLPAFRPRVLRDVKSKHALAMLVIVYFFLFNFFFNGWTGGWATGPRYLIPALPMLFVLAAPMIVKHPYIALPLVAISILNMFMVTSVRVLFPANNFGWPIDDNPVADAFRRLVMNQMTFMADMFNLGQRIGLRGAWSTLPPLGFIVIWAAIVVRMVRQRDARG